ncbi:hypothetical protein M011DRAFT_394086 [Sporormia fimetaria CBS 119925]|uniref:AMMECR1 domain-containing protein n=1 Tax=Sporormia fimetaria CBS 119925 TaxID=1340428 RepID=A0A6A6VS21_9PLEO|nr:hypothetical protein M011DRAFT_394086 [Sporormia fimetaria CBS 119925]
MATEAHCAYCFEALVANLEDREPLSLAQVTSLWKQYTTSDSPDTPDIDGPALIDTEPDTDLDDAPVTLPSSSLEPTYRSPAISRLQASTPSTASSSSVHSTVSTPSRTSEASSATSKSSSHTSLLSPLSSSRRTPALSEEKYPLFVSYHVIEDDGDKRLRGCIGTFTPEQLEYGLAEYALTSAFNDHRFRPLTYSSLIPALEVSVTLLTNFEPISDPFDWDIGTHGLRIAFTYKGRRYGSTYLPDVALEQGWTKEETLVSLMRKAGWNGKVSEWSRVQLSVVRYQGSKARLGFGEWREWRLWVEGREGVKA